MKDSQIALALEIYRNRWGGAFSAKAEFDHIKSSRQTKQELFDECERFTRWFEERIKREQGFFNLLDTILRNNLSAKEIIEKVESLSRNED